MDNANPRKNIAPAADGLMLFWMMSASSASAQQPPLLAPVPGEDEPPLVAAEPLPDPNAPPEVVTAPVSPPGAVSPPAVTADTVDRPDSTGLTGTHRRASGADRPNEIITWGDSIARGMGIGLNGVNGLNVTNMGIDSAGLLGGVRTVSTQRLLSQVDQGDAVIINIGTNDVGYLIGRGQGAMRAYAERVVEIARQVEARGGEAVIVGMQAPTGDYGAIRGSFRSQQWVPAMNALNQELERAAARAGIDFMDNESRARAGDGLHYTTTGSRNVGLQALNLTM
jgi:lysophospholipase L1-like esterase